MKKFLAILALAAFAFNFNLANLWADDLTAEKAEVALENAAVAGDTAVEETAEEAAAKLKAAEAKAVVPAVAEEEKKDELVAAIPADTTQTEAKVS